MPPSRDDEVSPTVPLPGPANIYRAGPRPPVQRTPCGYPAGPIEASDGTVYVVMENGQLLRREPKMTKAELKLRKKERRLKTCATRRGNHEQ